MKIRIVINTMQLDENTQQINDNRALVWEGNLELPDDEYITKISIIGMDGEEQPICDVPFSTTVGYYQWIPPMIDDDKLEQREMKIIENTDGL